jgi:Na+/H+-translocating membrane pyrophosphatase
MYVREIFCTDKVAEIMPWLAGVNLLSPVVFAFIIFGAMIPYWFSALTVSSTTIALPSTCTLVHIHEPLEFSVL